MKQLHKKFNDCQVKDLLTRYLKKKVEREEIQKVLDIKKTRFFALVKRLKDDSENFSVLYFRSIPACTISKDIETNIIKELNTEKDLIQAKEIPIKCYYSYIKEAIDNAIKVGSPSVSLCPGMVLFDKDLKFGWNQLIKSFKEIKEYTEDKNLVLLIEPGHKYETNLILTIEQCSSMIKVLKSEKFGILIDTGHANINGENLYENILKCKGIPLHIHLDDNKGDFDTHMVPGTGNIEFKPMFKALKKIEYCGFITIELGGNYILSPTSACRKSLQFVKGLI